MKEVKVKRYEDIVEVVESTIWNTVTNDRRLKDDVFVAVKSIFEEGNNMDTERNLVSVLNNEESGVVREIQRSIGDYLIRHIVDKNYMDEMVEIFKDKIIEEIVEDVKEDLEVLCLQDVEDMEIIAQCQYDNLIKEEDLSYGEVIIKTKTYISRMTIEDGAECDNQVSVEIWVNGNLEDTVKYECIPF